MSKTEEYKKGYQQAIEDCLKQIEERKAFYYDRYIKKGIGCIEESRYDACRELSTLVYLLKK